MDSIESNVRLVLNGSALTDQSAVICDYSLQQQISELAAKGVESHVSPTFSPILGTTVTYIVAAVLFNEKEEVLMMQEAKSKYAGQWYLPAGRMEANEDIVDAVKREVEEETGLSFEPNTLIMVECSQGNWFRFVFTGDIVGGILKTVAQADSESLQACWVSDTKQLSLRANDCLRLIEKGRQYLLEKESWYAPQLPALKEHKKLLLRIVVAIRRKENNRFHVLVSEMESPHLPVCEINPSRSIHAALKRFMQSIFGSERLPDHRPCGLLSVEHSGKIVEGSDGICLSLLVICKAGLEDTKPKSSYTWLQVEPEVESLLLKKFPKDMTINLKVI